MSRCFGVACMVIFCVTRHDLHWILKLFNVVHKADSARLPKCSSVFLPSEKTVGQIEKCLICRGQFFPFPHFNEKHIWVHDCLQCNIIELLRRAQFFSVCCSFLSFLQSFENIHLHAIVIWLLDGDRFLSSQGWEGNPGVLCCSYCLPVLCSILAILMSLPLLQFPSREWKLSDFHVSCQGMLWMLWHALLLFVLHHSCSHSQPCWSLSCLTCSRSMHEFLLSWWSVQHPHSIWCQKAQRGVISPGGGWKNIAWDNVLLWRSRLHWTSDRPFLVSDPNESDDFATSLSILPQKCSSCCVGTLDNVSHAHIALSVGDVCWINLKLLTSGHLVKNWNSENSSAQLNSGHAQTHWTTQPPNYWLKKRPIARGDSAKSMLNLAYAFQRYIR